MTSLDFVTQLSPTLKIKRADMVERDVILHQILTDLSNDGFFSKNFLLKGGTCLIKYYLGYFRFSERMQILLGGINQGSETKLQKRSEKNFRQS